MLDHKKMRVLIIATTYFELDGITNVILNYYRGMDKSDMIIDIVVPNDIQNHLRLELESSGSRIYKISDRQKNPLSYLSKLSKLIQENGYDIVHAHGNSCTLALEMAAAKKAGAKVRIPHSHNTTNKHKVVHKMLRGMFDASYTHGFACGQDAGEWLYEEKPFEIINNGIDISRFVFNSEVREAYRNQYDLVNNKVIGHIGYFSEVKNHKYLIDIFEALYQLDKSYRLILIGDGELKASMEEKVRDLGLSHAVVFTGKTLEVPQLLQAMDIMIMPSLFEGLPLTLVEAQTAGLPCFISDVITEEVGLTDLVEYISLEKSPREWAAVIHGHPKIDRSGRKEKITQTIIEAGYSITDNAKTLKGLYTIYCGSEQGI